MYVVQFKDKSAGSPIDNRTSVDWVHHYLELFAVSWNNLGPFAAVWTHLDPFQLFGAILSNLELIEAIWSDFGPFGAIMCHLEQFGAI